MDLANRARSSLLYWSQFRRTSAAFAAALSLGACATTSTSASRSGLPPISDMSPGEPYPDPRVGLRA
jgi:hypothetical protein